jgi:hypothetical protein
MHAAGNFATILSCPHNGIPMQPHRSIRDRFRDATKPDLLPSLYDRHPDATAAARRARGLQVVPLDQIVGTTRHPTQNTADFLPLPVLRGRNWEARWKRILKAQQSLKILPAIDLVQVGDEYYVVDGHNRVAAGRRSGAVAIDADVIELILPEVEHELDHQHLHEASDARTLLIGADEVRSAAAGRPSRTSERRLRVDVLRREELAGDEPGIGEVAGGEPAGDEPA